VPSVPNKGVSLPAATVPVPRVAVNVSNIGFCVSVGVACVEFRWASLLPQYYLAQLFA
jgi:hypothetical protein